MLWQAKTRLRERFVLLGREKEKERKREWLSRSHLFAQPNRKKEKTYSPDVCVCVSCARVRQNCSNISVKDSSSRRRRLRWWFIVGDAPPRRARCIIEPGKRAGGRSGAYRVRDGWPGWLRGSQRRRAVALRATSPVGDGVKSRKRKRVRAPTPPRRGVARRTRDLLAPRLCDRAVCARGQPVPFFPFPGRPFVARPWT